MSENQQLRNFIEKLQPEEQRYIGYRIRKECMITRSVYYDWKNGRSKIAPLYKKKIEEIIGSRIFEPVEA